MAEPPRRRPGGRGRLGFGEDLGDVEEMTLARVVGKALAAPAEEVAAEQGQGLGQLVVLLLQLLVIRRGLLEHAFEFVDPALGVFGLLSGGLGLLVPVVLFEQMFEFVDAALGVLGLLPQLVVAAEQVVEQPRAWTRIVRQAWCDAHHTNYTRSFMLCKSSSDDFRHLPGLGRGAGTACVAVRASQVDAGEEHGQLRRRDLDPVPSSDLGHLEGAGLEPLIPDGQAVTVEVEDLDPIPATVEEEEEMTGQQVLAEAFLNQAGKAVEALAEVGRPRTEENPDGRGEQDHEVASWFGRPASAVTSRPSHSGSGGASKRSRT